MSKLVTEAKKISKFLGMEQQLIAARFSDELDERSDSTRKMSICKALYAAKHKKLLLSFSKENCTCAGGRHFTGLEIVPVEALVPALTTKTHRVYDSVETALVSVKKQPQPVKRGSYLILGPLGKFNVDPDIVFLFVNPSQAERMLELISFKGAEPFMYYPVSSICSSVTNVLAKNKPEINLIASSERRTGIWSPDELILALPFKDFEVAVENISEPGLGT